MGVCLVDTMTKSRVLPVLRRYFEVLILCPKYINVHGKLRKVAVKTVYS